MMMLIEGVRNKRRQNLCSFVASEVEGKAAPNEQQKQRKGKKKEQQCLGPESGKKQKDQMKKNEKTSPFFVAPCFITREYLGA